MIRSLVPDQVSKLVPDQDSEQVPDLVPKLVPGPCWSSCRYVSPWWLQKQEPRG